MPAWRGLSVAMFDHPWRSRWPTTLRNRGLLVGHYGLGIARGQALPPIIRNGAIDDRAAVDAFPGVEYQEEVGKPFQHHEAFAFWTFHRILPGCDVYCCRLDRASTTPICRCT